jgi:hypothetical protein
MNVSPSGVNQIMKISWIGILFLLLTAGVQFASAWDEMPTKVATIAQKAQDDARKSWRRDAYLASIEMRHIQGNTQRHELTLTLYSPSKKRGRTLIFGGQFGDQSRDWKDHYDYSVGPIPTFTIDVGEAVTIARKNGLAGELSEAILQTRQLGKQPPTLAWVVKGDKTDAGKEVVVEAFTGEILRYDRVFDSLEKRNAEITASATRLWNALRRQFSGGAGGSQDGFSPAPFELSPSSDGNSGGGYNQAESDRQSGLSNAYWNGGPEAYERAQNGTMTWDDKCRFQGC